MPRALCGPFDGRPAALPPSYDAETERDLAELFKHLDGSLPRSEAQHRKEEEQAGNLWINPLFRLPAAPRDPQALAALDDLSFLEAIFGDHRAYLAAREAAAKRRQSATVVPAPRQPLLGRTEKLILMLLGLFALLAIGGALIAHRLQTGGW